MDLLKKKFLKIFTLIVFAFACLMAAQQTTIPKFTIEIYGSRISSYDYRIATDGSKQYLEMRQTGKKKWARVEEVTCPHGPGRFESESFDHVTICQ